MTNGGAAADGQPIKKSGCGGCAGIALAVVLLFMVLIVVSCVNNAKEPKANPYAYTPTAVPVIAVDSATVSKVKTACEDQLKAVAASSKRHFSGVPDKPYDVTSVTFSGDVKKVDLPYKKIAWEVPLTWVSKVADGSGITNKQVCQFRELQQDATMLNR